jgi:predicted dehydrogenase
MSNPTRRSFLVASSLTALAATRAMGANETLRLGVIGAGQRMGSLLDCVQKSSDPTQIVAVSDVFKPHRDSVVELSKGHASAHIDYRAVLDKKDIDAVLIATPDHWHVKIATDALAAGKDVYCEKPVTHTLEEGDTLIHAVRSSKQILQCGMQQRSWAHFRDAVELIQSGHIGKVLQVRTYWWQNYQRNSGPGSQRVAFNQSDLDWKQYLGSAPAQPFVEEKFYRWRWYWDFGGGAMTDLFTHWIDIVHWALNSDQPTQAFLLADKYYFKEWDCPDTLQAGFRYPATDKNPQPFDVVYEGMMASSIDDGGLDFRGTDGSLKLSRSGFSISKEGVRGDQNPILTAKNVGDGTVAHMQNFFDSIKSRKDPNAPVEAGVAAARAGHIGNYAYHHGGQTKWPI